MFPLIVLLGPQPHSTPDKHHQMRPKHQKQAAVRKRPPGNLGIPFLASLPLCGSWKDMVQPLMCPPPSRIKSLKMFQAQDLQSVLSQLVEPPRPEALLTAKSRLRDLGALTPEEELTPLGYHLASLPVDVRIGKLMLFGCIFRCLDPALTIAASLAFKSPFVSVRRTLWGPWANPGVFGASYGA